MRSCPRCFGDNIRAFTFVKCLDCGAKTHTYRTGETQDEERYALHDWNSGILMSPEEQKAEELFWAQFK